MVPQGAAKAHGKVWPSVYVLVLNLDGKEHLEYCLPSLAATDYANYELVLVDNASTDGSVAFTNLEAPNDYIRARRYMPESGNGLRGTDLAPDYFKSGFFQPGVRHKITIIKHGNDLYMHITSPDKKMLCHWKNTDLPPIEKGRIGLRHMASRNARYKDFRVSEMVE